MVDAETKFLRRGRLRARASTTDRDFKSYRNNNMNAKNELNGNITTSHEVFSTS